MCENRTSLREVGNPGRLCPLVSGLHSIGATHMLLHLQALVTVTRWSAGHLPGQVCWMK